MADEPTCPRCGMGKHLWQGNGGQGVTADDGTVYCCEGCMNDTGCTCDDPGD